ncbi:MAG: insulinase family protein, partial [Eubacterium sp.]|nr:insulinase family protein [Eubacterium sp.]
TYPKGLMYGLNMFDSWLYDDKEPFIHVESGSVFEELRAAMETDYYENLIKECFLDNKHASLVKVEPKVGMTAQMDQEEADRLAACKAKMSQEDLERLVRETEELKAYQEEPNTPEELKCIPLLAREDIGREVEPFSNIESQVEEIPFLQHDYQTNGIAYVRLSFDIKDLTAYAPYLGLLSELISGMDTEKRDKLALSNEILIHAGSFSVSANSYERMRSDDYRLFMEVTTKVLYRELPYLMELTGEILTQTILKDEKRLKEIVGEVRSGQQASKLGSGHTTAAQRAGAYLSDRLACVEYIKGISYYDFLCDLEDNFEERKDQLIEILQALTKEIFTKKRMSVSVTGDEEGAKALKEALPSLMSALPDQGDGDLPEAVYKVEPLPQNEGFKTASKVQYVARCGNFAKKGIAYDGSYRVVKKILSYDYLWNEVRVKGGAYGVMCSFTPSGYGSLMSYRDPNLENTNEVYKKIPDYLDEFDADERDMMKYIIGTISDLDTPLTPRTKGARSYQAYQLGITLEEKQRERQEVLATDQAKVRQAAAMVRAVLEDEKICTIGGEEKVEAAADLFDHVRVLK